MEKTQNIRLQHEVGDTKPATVTTRLINIAQYRIFVVFNFANFERIFNRSQKYFNENFWHETHALFSSSDCKSVDEQHPGAKLLNSQGTLF